MKPKTFWTTLFLNMKNICCRDPGDLEARLRLANVFYRLEALDKSIEGYRLVLNGKPNDPLASLQFGHGLPR